MRDSQMEQSVALLLDDERFEKYIPVYLDAAKDALTTYCYPFCDTAVWEDVPNRHHFRACEIAAYLINRRGAEGQLEHSENGVNRKYESSRIPESFFTGIVPFASAP